MYVFFALIGLLGLISGITKLVVNLIKKKSKRQSLVVTGVSFIVLIISVLLTPVTAIITINEVELITDSKGIVIVEGTTNTEARLTVNGIEIKNEKGKFSYKVELEDAQSEEIKFLAKIEDSVAEEIITVTPSEEFIAFVNEQKEEEERLRKVESALALAEKNPSEENYDKAATLVSSLTKEYESIKGRLKNVLLYVEAEEAVALAEKELTSNSLKNAQLLVENVSLNQSSFSNRLESIQIKVTEREALFASAEEAIILAEGNPTDQNYAQAVELIESLPGDSSKFKTRVATVKTTIQKNKEKEEEKRIAAEKAAEEAAVAEAAAMASQPAVENSEPEDYEQVVPDSVEEIVLVTRTGKKYHTHKCGNGDYYEATWETALARGLEPCSKCY